MSFDRLLGQRGHACGNVSINRNVGNAYFLHRRNQRARLASMPIEETFALEGGDVLHNRGLTGEAEMTLDLARARRDSLFPLLALDKIENAFLTIGQHPTIIGEGDQCASSNEQMRLGQTAKLSPQEQCATAFGFVTLNPPFCRSSL